MIYRIHKGVRGFRLPRKYNIYKGGKTTLPAIQIASIKKYLPELPEVDSLDKDDLKKGVPYAALPLLGAVTILSFTLLDNSLQQNEGTAGNTTTGRIGRNDTPTMRSTGSQTDSEGDSTNTVSGTQPSQATGGQQAGDRGGERIDSLAANQPDNGSSEQSSGAPNSSDTSSSAGAEPPRPVGGRGGGELEPSPSVPDTDSGGGGAIDEEPDLPEQPPKKPDGDNENPEDKDPLDGHLDPIIDILDPVTDPLTDTLDHTTNELTEPALDLLTKPESGHDSDATQGQSIGSDDKQAD